MTTTPRPVTYLDASATAPLRDEARAAMTNAIGMANPSSVHAAGRDARRLLEEARADVLATVGIDVGRVVFTSGATEAAALALTPDYALGRGSVRFERLLVGATEHPCVLAGGRFAPRSVATIPVDRRGVLDLQWLEHALGEGGPALVAAMLVNNETGVIQPIAEIGRMVRAKGGALVCDAAQGPGKVELAAPIAEADMTILSSHKAGGPMGAGALVLRGGQLVPGALLRGGAQEDGLRAGTENVAAIAGFAAALRSLPDATARERVGSLRNRFETGLRRVAPTATIHAAEAPRAPNTSLFSFATIAGETAQIAFDLDGVAVSSGSACASGKVGRSHVLDAMGLRGPGAVRISLSVENDVEDIDRALATAARLGARDVEKSTARRAAAA